MKEESERQEIIDQCVENSEATFFIYKPTWSLITKALMWSIGKTREEIKTRIGICEAKRDKQKVGMMRRNWQLIIESLKWTIGESETDPIQARNALGF